MLPRLIGFFASLYLACLLLVLSGCSNHEGSAQSKTKPVIAIPEMLGGENSVDIVSANAFSMPSTNMPLTQKINFSVGNSFFRNAWVIAPSSTTARDGLGPLFNTTACQNCHIKDGRGHLPNNAADNTVSMLVRLSAPGEPASEKDGVLPDPIYGGQLQDFAINGYQPEAKIEIQFYYHSVSLADGEEVELRTPKLRLSDFSHQAMAADALTSIRVAPQVLGLGYLQALTETQLLANADPEDSNNDGISGRANRVWDIEKNASVMGRFGWKAEQPSLKQQNAMAFVGDMGLTSPLVAADDCTSSQLQCRQAVNGGEPEVSAKILDQVTFYTANLAVPKRRNVADANVVAGSELFQTVGCADCHTPQWQTGEVEDMPWLANQTIYPFTDLLLHDMGDELSDHRPVFNAAGNEWRTPPLWGIGLTSTVNNEFGYLHDGRARSVQEAILWHGGEAASARDQYSQMASDDREKLLAFLDSL